jgi:hypothetical protein
MIERLPEYGLGDRVDVRIGGSGRWHPGVVDAINLSRSGAARYHVLLDIGGSLLFTPEDLRPESCHVDSPNPLGVGDRATADDPRWGDMDDHAVVVRISNYSQTPAATPIWLRDAILGGPHPTYEVLHLGWRQS